MIQVHLRISCIHLFLYKITRTTGTLAVAAVKKVVGGEVATLWVSIIQRICVRKKWWVKCLTKVETPCHFICRSFSFVNAFQKPSLFKNLFHFANVAPATWYVVLCVSANANVCVYVRITHIKFIWILPFHHSQQHVEFSGVSVSNLNECEYIKWNEVE